MLFSRHHQSRRTLARLGLACIFLVEIDQTTSCRKIIKRRGKDAMEKARFLPASPTATYDSGLAANPTGSADMYNKWRTFIASNPIERLFVHKLFRIYLSHFEFTYRQTRYSWAMLKDGCMSCRGVSKLRAKNATTTSARICIWCALGCFCCCCLNDCR